VKIVKTLVLALLSCRRNLLHKPHASDQTHSLAVVHEIQCQQATEHTCENFKKLLCALVYSRSYQSKHTPLTLALNSKFRNREKAQQTLSFQYTHEVCS
jgi:hypothetical protein